jgi:hypothetical protein
MAYTVKEVLAMRDERLAAEKSGTTIPSGDQPCVICQKPMDDLDRQEAEQTPEGRAHRDCYYDNLGDLMEKHPPGLPGAGRFGS